MTSVGQLWASILRKVGIILGIQPFKKQLDGADGVRCETKSNSAHQRTCR